MNLFENLEIPDFDNFKLTPRNKHCLPIDTTRLLVEVLGGLEDASDEFEGSNLSSKILLDGGYSLVMRYRREKDDILRPTCTLSFDRDCSGNICLNQIQGSKDNKVAFRFNSSFNNVLYYIKLIEESFSKKGKYVYVKDFPTGLEGASYGATSRTKYSILSAGVENLNKKYGLESGKNS